MDDAAFALTLTISRLISCKQPVTIINCFTVTKWTSVFVSRDIKEVTLLRQQEDVEFNKLFNSAINIINLHMLDAPLRNGYIFQAKPFEPNEWDLVEDLKNYLIQNQDGLLLCPLGIGNHIDHAICAEAILQLYKNMKVLFYEDLPYTARITPGEITQHTNNFEKRLDVKFVSYISAIQKFGIDKEQALHIYKSQINDEICSQIISYMNETGGERLWGEVEVIDQLKRLMNAE